MLNFATDYMCGTLPEVMAALQDTNMVATPGYGTDCFCEDAKQKIKVACKCPDWEVHFTSGGTQTNATVIDSVIRPGQGVLAAESAHINVHESGAVEAYFGGVSTYVKKDFNLEFEKQGIPVPELLPCERGNSAECRTIHNPD